MAENITLIGLSQMVDISLNCQDLSKLLGSNEYRDINLIAIITEDLTEIKTFARKSKGVINFQALHTLLHVMLQQLNLNDVAIEFRGADSDRIQTIISTMKPGPITQLLPKYTIKESKGSKEEKDAKNGKKKKGVAKKELSLQDVVQERQKIEEKKEKELRVIERRKDSKEDPELNPLPLKSPPGSLLGILPGDLQTIVVVEQQSQLPQFSVAMSKSKFDEMQNQIKTMEEQIKELVDLPGNMGLIEASRTASGPILDMFSILNLTKRMESTELAMEKLGSLLGELAKSIGSTEVMDLVQEVKDTVDLHSDARRKSSTIIGLEKRLAEIEKTIEIIIEGGAGDLDVAAFHHDHGEDEEKEHPGAGKPKASITPSESGGSKQRKSIQKEKDDSLKILSPQMPYTPMLENVDLGHVDVHDGLMLIQEEFQNIKKYLASQTQEIDSSMFRPPSDTGIDNAVIESKFNDYHKQLEEMNNLYNDQIGQLNDQLTTVQHEMTDVITKLEVVLPGGDSAGINAETTMDLANKLGLLEHEIISISDRAAKLQEEKEISDRQTEAIMEQIDVLKIVKANREDLEEALGDKADACMINRKVSHDQFDAACDDLSRGIEEALKKLEEQEEMWHQALDAIQKEVGSKLDKMEVDPLRDFVNSKIKALQEKFRSLTALRKEQEAAGTKSKFLRNVNCISCDKDVVMRKEMDISLKPKAFAMPPGRNMAPYLAYELDQLRKQQKCVPGSKNLNFIENALKVKRGTKDKDHLCNRYCGGSHTVTTPQQRVTRLGHFLEQWGPEIAPLQDEYIRGIDNQMYKARDENLYKKANQQGSPSKGTKKPTKDNPPPENEAPTQEVFVSPEAKEAIAKEDHGDSRKKPNNIGAAHLPTDPEDKPKEHRDSQTTEGRTSRQNSQIQEKRKSSDKPS